jgi:hypothetical protein
MMADLSAFQRDLLYVLTGMAEPNGLAIRDELGKYYESEIHHGRLYLNLDDLAENGLVEKGQRDWWTNKYALTDRDRRGDRGPPRVGTAVRRDQRGRLTSRGTIDLPGSGIPRTETNRGYYMFSSDRRERLVRCEALSWRVWPLTAGPRHPYSKIANVGIAILG